MKEDYKVWTCKVGVKGDLLLPPGADLPMREAVRRAFYELTGVEAEFCFSGWGDQLSDAQKQVVEERQ